MQSIALLFLRLLTAYLTPSGPESSELPRRPQQVGLRLNELILDSRCSSENFVVNTKAPTIVESQLPYMKLYETNISCTLKLWPGPDQDGMVVVVKLVDTFDNKDQLRIRPQTGEASIWSGHKFRGLLEDQRKRSFIFRNQTVQIDWTSSERDVPFVPGKGFGIVATPFQLDGCRGNRNCFKCDNGIFIDEEFHCDGENGCGDLSDERNCDRAVKKTAGYQ